MNHNAVRALVAELWNPPAHEVTAAAMEHHVAMARELLGRPWAAPDRVKVARALVAAAESGAEVAPVDYSPAAARDRGESSVIAFPGATPEPEPTTHDDAALVVGVAEDGTAISMATMYAEGVYPAWGRIKMLTPLGTDLRRLVIASGRPDPMLYRVAEGRGIDVAAVQTAARAYGLDPDRALEAEVQMHELVERDAAALGYPPPPRTPGAPSPRVVSFDEAAVRQAAKAAGMDEDKAVAAERDMHEMVARDRAAWG